MNNVDNGWRFLTLQVFEVIPASPPHARSKDWKFRNTTRRIFQGVLIERKNIELATLHDQNPKDMELLNWTLEVESLTPLAGVGKKEIYLLDTAWLKTKYRARQLIPLIFESQETNGFYQISSIHTGIAVTCRTGPARGTWHRQADGNQVTDFPLFSR